MVICVSSSWMKKVKSGEMAEQRSRGGTEGYQLRCHAAMRRVSTPSIFSKTSIFLYFCILYFCISLYTLDAKSVQTFNIFYNLGISLFLYFYISLYLYFYIHAKCQECPDIQCFQHFYTSTFVYFYIS